MFDPRRPTSITLSLDPHVEPLVFKPEPGEPPRPVVKPGFRVPLLSGDEVERLMKSLLRITNDLILHFLAAFESKKYLMIDNNYERNI